MPRLLSNKEPTKKSEPKILNKSMEPTKKSEPKILNKLPEPKRKSEDEMSSGEYYKYLMRFGKRKMDRFEWLTWKLKKDDEQDYRRYIMKKNRAIMRVSAKYFNWRAFHIGDIDERLMEIDPNL